MKRSKFALAYAIFGAVTCLGYVVWNVAGWEIESPKREAVPASVRNSPGGYRSYHFWHGGFHGGK